MHAQVNRQGDVIVIQLQGRVDVETAEPFRNACLEKLGGQNVVFDFKNLSFVGSSGILPFLETLTQFQTSGADRLKFSSVGSEFQKVFAATPLSAVGIYENATLASLSFSNPMIQALQVVPLVETSVGAPQGFLSFGAPPEEISEP